MSRPAAVLAAAALAAAAAAEPTTLTLDASSNIAFTATLSTPVGSDTDSDSSTVSGTITIELDTYGNPTQITLHDFSFAVDQALSMSFDYGFFGSVDVDVPSAAAAFASPGSPAGPVAVAGDTTFVFPTVLTNLTGSGSATGNIFLIGDIDESFNLADFNPFATDFAGSVSVADGIVTLAGTINFEGSGEVFSGVTLDMSGTLTISATGDAPEQCPADWNNDGVADFFDVQQFLGDFSAMNQNADLVDDDVFNFFDVQSFLQAFSAGCP
jgi:hypothetical protein